MVLADFFQNVFMKTQTSDVKYFFQAIFDGSKKNKNGCGFWAKIGQNSPIFESEMLLKIQKQV